MSQNELHLKPQSRDPGKLLSVPTSFPGIISKNKDFRQPFQVKMLFNNDLPDNNFISRQPIETGQGEYLISWSVYRLFWLSHPVNLSSISHVKSFC